VVLYSLEDNVGTNLNILMRDGKASGIRKVTLAADTVNMGPTNAYISFHECPYNNFLNDVQSHAAGSC
jgi:hypothetical protein